MDKFPQKGNGGGGNAKPPKSNRETKLEKQVAELQSQLKAGKTQETESDGKEEKAKPSLADLETAISIAEKIGSKPMLKAAQQALEEHNKAAAKQAPVSHSLRQIFNKYDADEKRLKKASTDLLNARERIHKLEKAALEASTQFLLTQHEKCRLLRQEGHLNATQPGEPTPDPPPESLDEEQQAVWHSTFAMHRAEADANARAELAERFKKVPGMEVDDRHKRRNEESAAAASNANQGVGFIKKAKHGDEKPDTAETGNGGGGAPGTPPANGVNVPIAPGTSGSTQEGDTTMATDDNAAAFEGKSPLDEADADLELTSEELEQKSKELLQRTMDEQSRERKKGEDGQEKEGDEDL
jgi:hypothetical protein